VFGILVVEAATGLPRLAAVAVVGNTACVTQHSRAVELERWKAFAFLDADRRWEI